MAYRLELPPHSQLQLVFHVSQLKKQLRQSDQTITDLPKVTDEGAFILQPMVIRFLLGEAWAQGGSKGFGSLDKHECK